MTENKIGFGVLGPLQMTVARVPLTLGTPKQRAVLAMLVMNRNRPVSTDSLITAAWEEWPPAEARASLHSYVSNLRKLLSGAGADPKSLLVNAPPGYRLDLADTACDIGRFGARASCWLSPGLRVNSGRNRPSTTRPPRQTNAASDHPTTRARNVFVMAPPP